MKKDAITQSGFLPYVSEPQNATDPLCHCIANIRSESYFTVVSVYHSLEPGFRLVFERELCLSHHDLAEGDHKGKRALQLSGYEELVKAVRSSEDALTVLARLLEQGRVEAVKLANSAPTGQHAVEPLVVDVSDLVEYADEIAGLNINLRDHGLALVATARNPTRIDFHRIEEIKSLKDVHTHSKLGLKQPLSSCAFLGGGGGSDVIQAAALAHLLKQANPEMKVPVIISTRSRYCKSTSAGKKRSVCDGNDNPDPEHNLLDSANGDLKIETSHRGNGRFVEDTIAADFENVRLVVDDKSEKRQLVRQRYIGAIGKGVDSMIIMDTGGDVLAGMNSPTGQQAPDQDLRTQLTTAEIADAQKLSAIVAIAALGVDAPVYAQQNLEQCEAVYYSFTDEDRQFLTHLYSEWHFDGSTENLKTHPERYGKTPFAMLASFKLKPGESGYHALPLPESVINDFDNPWTCITWITPEMACLVLANQAKLLSVLVPLQAA